MYSAQPKKKKMKVLLEKKINCKERTGFAPV